MKTDPTLLILAPVPRLRKRTRLAKFARAYKNDTSRISFIGWERLIEEASHPHDDEVSSTHIVHVGGGYATDSLGQHYAKWVTKAAVQTVRLNPDTIHALGLEGALASLPQKILRPRTVLLYDDADRMTLCHKMPERARRIGQFVERMVTRASSAHIIPGEARYPDGLPNGNTILLKNTPSVETLEQALELPVEVSDRFDLLVTGWLGDTRGAAVIDAIAAELAEDKRFRFVAAGRVTGDAAERFVQRDSVDYRGEVSNAEALRLARDSSLVFTLYDPAVIINRYAEPNKWGDCVAVGTPFIVNREVETAAEYVESGAAVEFGYHNPSEAAELIRQLAEDGEMYKSLCDRISSFPSTSFDSVISESIRPLLSGSAQATR